MGKSKPHRKPSSQVSNESSKTGDSVEKVPSIFESRTTRWIISIGLIGYMSVVVLGPLANPVGSEFLTRPLAEFVAPIHRALFLGHGYRFFGPDPGPSHLVVYRISGTDGTPVEGHFPDREKIWPRLMYHRWFMLSETVFRELSSTPDEQSYRRTDAEMETQIKELRASGKFALSERITRERSKLAVHYKNTRQRIDSLVQSIAGHLLTVHDSDHIELFVQERSIPFAVQILTGDELDDDKFLSPLTKIGEFRLGDDGKPISLEIIPAEQPDFQENGQ